MNFELVLLPYKGLDRGTLDTLMKDLAALGIEVRRLAQAELPSKAYHPRRRQYRADVLLEQVHGVSGGRRLLGVTDCDLYADTLNFSSASPSRQAGRRSSP